MKFDVDDKNICRLVCVKFHLNRCRFAVAVAKCLGGSLLLGHSQWCIGGYTRVYAVYQPPGFFDSVYSPE